MKVKTREEIVAEREAKKKAKMAKKKTVEDSSSQAAVSLSNTPTDLEPQCTKTVPGPVPSLKIRKGEGKAVRKSGTVSDSQSSKPDGQKDSQSNPNLATQKTSILNHVKPEAAVNQEETVNLVKSHSSRKVDSKVDIKESNVKSAEPIAEDIPVSKTEGLTKAELKVARRMKQEMQRAAKAAGSQESPKTQKPATGTEVKSSNEALEKKPERKMKTNNFKNHTLKLNPKLVHKVKLFNHLYCDDELCINGSLAYLHPAIISLGIQYANKIIVGSNARCFSFMNALKKVIEDYTTPQQKEFARGLESYLQPCLIFLHRCRPLAVSMINAMKHLKWQMTQLPNDVSDDEAKKKLQEAIDTYLRDEIEVAAQAICITVQKKIADGDVILTYGCSSLVQRILIEAHLAGTKFRVIIVDARPLCEGLQLLHRLGKHGIHCSYVLVGAASCMMREATRVLLGAHALLANGYVMSRAGSSQVALLAHAYNVPVLVCCETYKFCERVQTDALVHNEIGDPEALVPCQSEEDVKPLADWHGVINLTLLNLTYDVTPPDLVTAVVTELAILPCTSVPVVLRIKPSDSHH